MHGLPEAIARPRLKSPMGEAMPTHLVWPDA